MFLLVSQSGGRDENPCVALLFHLVSHLQLSFQWFLSLFQLQSSREDEFVFCLFVTGIYKCSPRFPKHNQVTWPPLCSRDVPNHVSPPWKYQLRWDEDLTRWTVQKIIKFEKRRNLPPCSRSCNAAFATPTLEQKKISHVIYREKKSEVALNKFG